MNNNLFKSLPLLLLTLVLGLTVGCSDGSTAGYMAASEMNQIPPKGNHNTADMAAGESDGEEIPDKPEEEASHLDSVFYG